MTIVLCFQVYVNGIRRLIKIKRSLAVMLGIYFFIECIFVECI